MENSLLLYEIKHVSYIFTTFIKLFIQYLFYTTFILLYRVVASTHLFTNLNLAKFVPKVFGCMLIKATSHPKPFFFKSLSVLNMHVAMSSAQISSERQASPLTRMHLSAVSLIPCLYSLISLNVSFQHATVVTRISICREEREAPHKKTKLIRRERAS